MKRLNLQLERRVYEWARAEAARLDTDLSGLVTMMLRSDPKFRARTRISRAAGRAAPRRRR
jgi:hypothetical protein